MRKYFYLLSWAVKKERGPFPDSYTPASQVIAITDLMTEVLLGKILSRLLPDLSIEDDVIVLGISEVSSTFTNNYKDFTNINLDEQ